MGYNIWMWHHNALGMHIRQSGRHTWFAKYLQERGNQCVIFSASTIHNSDRVIDTGSQLFREIKVHDVPFVVINAPKYQTNGRDRIWNMILFYQRLFPVARAYAAKHGKPDVIIASSVHPLTLVAGIKIARQWGIPCICEVRDLWPLSLVEYGMISANHILTKIMYRGEKWIYENADALIFSMEGGKDYIRDQGWDLTGGGRVDLAKVHHINNGVDLNNFRHHRDEYPYPDDDLQDDRYFRVIYSGSIRKANKIRKLIQAAEFLRNEPIRFFVFGEGNEREELEQYCKDTGLDNFFFKGWVDKHFIPSILSQGDLNYFHFEQNELKKYGGSLNKMFEYFASGKPTLSDCEMGYDLIQRYQCGLNKDQARAEDLAELIRKAASLSEADYATMCNNALRAAEDYDYAKLTGDLESLVAKVVHEYKHRG